MTDTERQPAKKPRKAVSREKADTPSTPSPKPAFERPKNGVGLLSDLFRDRGQVVNMLLAFGGVVSILTICVVVVARATKGVKFGGTGALHTALPYGMGAAASYLAFLARRVYRWIKRKLAKTGRADPPDS